MGGQRMVADGLAIRLLRLRRQLLKEETELALGELVVKYALKSLYGMDQVLALPALGLDHRPAPAVCPTLLQSNL